MAETVWVGPHPNEPWEKKEERRRKMSLNYRNVDKFLDDMRSDSLPERFTLSESLFLELTGKVASEPEIAKLISEQGIILLLKADRGAEVDGLVELATQVAGEQNG